MQHGDLHTHLQWCPTFAGAPASSPRCLGRVWAKGSPPRFLNICGAQDSCRAHSCRTNLAGPHKESCAGTTDNLQSLARVEGIDHHSPMGDPSFAWWFWSGEWCHSWCSRIPKCTQIGRLSSCNKRWASRRFWPCAHDDVSTSRPCSWNKTDHSDCHASAASSKWHPKSPNQLPYTAHQILTVTMQLSNLTIVCEPHVKRDPLTTLA